MHYSETHWRFTDWGTFVEGMDDSFEVVYRKISSVGCPTTR